MTPETSEVSSPGTCYSVKLDANYEHLILRLDSNALTKKMVAMTGVPVTRPLKVDAAPDMASPAMQSFRNLVMYLVGELTTAVNPFPKLVLNEFEQTLLVSFLCGNRHNYSHLLKQQPADVAPWQVRRAEEFIEAHWNQPIDIEQLATATNVSMRSIFRAFKKTRGYSPMAFAKLVRMRHAQRLLNSANSTTTITDVALDCGFKDLSHFSKDYLRTLGELPSETLKRGKDTA
jgi:AraC-like DNA-binding protein